MQRLTLNGLCLIPCLILVGALSAALAVIGTRFSLNNASEQTERLCVLRENHLRCLNYWTVRSAIADAHHEFEKGRYGLIQVIGAIDPSLEYETPGLRQGATAVIRTDYPLHGPEMIDNLSIKTLSAPKPSCSPVLYAWDYNFTMLGLLGRGRDAEIRVVSPELREKPVARTADTPR